MVTAIANRAYSRTKKPKGKKDRTQGVEVIRVVLCLRKGNYLTRLAPQIRGKKATVDLRERGPTHVSPQDPSNSIRQLIGAKIITIASSERVTEIVDSIAQKWFSSQKTGQLELAVIQLASNGSAGNKLYFIEKGKPSKGKVTFNLE